MRPPVIVARDTAVPMPLTRAPDDVANRQSIPVSKSGDTTCAMGRSERRTRAPGTSTSTCVERSCVSDAQFCRRPVCTSPTVSIPSASHSHYRALLTDGSTLRREPHQVQMGVGDRVADRAAAASAPGACLPLGDVLAALTHLIGTAVAASRRAHLNLPHLYPVGLGQLPSKLVEHPPQLVGRVWVGCK